MKYLALILMFFAIALPSFGQTTAPKKGEINKSGKSSTPKTGAAKSSSSKATSTSKAKPGTSKTNARSNSTATSVKSSTSRTRSSPSAKASGPNRASTSAAKAKVSTPKTGLAAKTSKRKPAETKKEAVETVDDKAEFEATAAIVELAARIDALRKFLATHSRSEHAAPALDLLIRTQAESGGSSLRAGDLQTAFKTFRAAIKDTPNPIPDRLFAEVVSRFPAALFWGGQRNAAFELAAMLEEKCAAHSGQLLSIAEFYMSIENGAEAKRIANAVIAREPASSPAYMTMGLANRIDFRLDDAAAAYARALELNPASNAARRGLAEMKRAQGKPDEAAELYRQILAGDSSNVPAQTGLILSLFDADKRADAESAMTASLEANPGNVMLLAGAAYWYAARLDGKKSIELAQRAIAADPRFIWSHIALARGYLAEKLPMDAEKTLLAARRYGNFPTLDYEIASARAMAGFYREAAEELAKSFTVKDGVISTKLGGRISRESADFGHLVSFERRASISTPTAADTPENAARLRSLLELWTRLGAKQADADALSKATDDFTRGDDNMHVHRQLFAAKELLDRKMALPKVLLLSKAAIEGVDTSLDVPSPSAAVMADELYDSRKLAASRNEYIRVPDVPRNTLLNIVRGRIEDLNGRALFETDNKMEAVVHLKRAVSILPAGSSWWRTSAWRLGEAQESAGKSNDALEAYIRSYKDGQPDVIRYTVIASLYKRLNGSLAGLEARIGPNPAAEQVAKNVEPTSTPGASVPVRSVGENPAIMNDPVDQTPKTNSSRQPTPETTQTEPVVTASPEAKSTPTIGTPKSDPTPEPSPAKAPDATRSEPTPQPTLTPKTKVSEPKAEPTPTDAAVTSEVKSSATPEENLVAKSVEPSAKKTDEITPVNESASGANPDAKGVKELFPPVVITIPRPGSSVKKVDSPEPKRETPPATDQKKEPSVSPPTEVNVAESPTDAKLLTGDARPRPVEEKAPDTATRCSLTLSETTLTLQNGGGDLAIIAGTEDDRDVSGIKAESSDPKDVEVRREPIEGIKGRALFVVRSISGQTGTYRITFVLPCGQKELLVKVR